MYATGLDQLIESTPGVMSGKPRIAGRRITVAHVAIWHIRQGISVDAIADDYDLSLVQIYAALTYYFQNQKEIDQSIADSEAYIEEMRKQSPSKLQEKLNSQLRSA